jgi:cytochrome c biogenesis protein
MAELTAQPAGPASPGAARRSPLEIGVDRVWRFFCSVRAAIYEIAFLALLVLIGTLRGSSVPRWIADALPFTEPIVDRWYAWDVYRSFPFIAICFVIAVAIAVCTVNRAPGIWRSIAHPTVRTSHGFLRGAEPSATVDSPRRVEDFVAELSGLLRARRYRVLTERRGEEVHLYADKHRLAKLGTFPFHLALILIMVGGIVGARFGFRETEFIIAEGETRPIGHGSGLALTLERFSDEYNLDGTAREYRSELVLLEGGEPVKREAITVNNPMTHGTYSIYQASFGQTVVLRVTDARGMTLFDGPVDMGIYRSVVNPDAPAGILQLPQACLTLNVIAPDENPWNQPELDQIGLRSGEVYLQARRTDAPEGCAAIPAGYTPAASIVTQGGTVALDGIQVQFVREGRFALLQIARNPGIPIFIAAAFLLVGGLAITFYFPHRRVRGIVSATPTGSAVHLAPLARRDWSGQRDFHRLLGDLEERLHLKARLLAPSKPTADEPDPPTTTPGKSSRRSRPSPGAAD